MSMMAYCVPNAWNIWIVNKGKAAAKELRMAELAAIALAATGRNASTRYKKTLWKDQSMPMPNGTVAISGTIQCTEV